MRAVPCLSPQIVFRFFPPGRFFSPPLCSASAGQCWALFVPEWSIFFIGPRSSDLLWSFSLSSPRFSAYVRLCFFGQERAPLVLPLLWTTSPFGLCRPTTLSLHLMAQVQDLSRLALFFLPSLRRGLSPLRAVFFFLISWVGLLHVWFLYRPLAISTFFFPLRPFFPCFHSPVSRVPSHCRSGSRGFPRISSFMIGEGELVW